ncbi:MAG: hypothetical protein IJD04_02085 [Desulfovibrionaceae bacterium]|nr:hypothetical protein [Desulfovibrionaceae bacterium]
MEPANRIISLILYASKRAELKRAAEVQSDPDFRRTSARTPVSGQSS